MQAVTTAVLFFGALAVSRARRRTRSQSVRREPYVELIHGDLSKAVVRIGERTVEFILTLPPDAIEPLFSGAAWAGTVVWPASVFLANYLEDSRVCEGKTCIELGAGVGVPGITACVLGAKRVILSEQPPLADLLQLNVANNELAIDVVTFDWLRPIPHSLDDVNVVLISDCIYEGLYGESWRALGKVLGSLLKDSTRFALNSVERRKEDGIDRFIDYCEKGFGISSKLIKTKFTPDKIIELYEMRLIKSK